MSQTLEVAAQQLLLTALLSSVQMLNWLDTARVEEAQEIFDMCGVCVTEFEDYIFNNLANKLHFGEPVLMIVTLYSNSDIKLEHDELRYIQSELGEVLTEEWLEKLKAETSLEESL